MKTREFVLTFILIIAYLVGVFWIFLRNRSFFAKLSSGKGLNLEDLNLMFSVKMILNFFTLLYIIVLMLRMLKKQPKNEQTDIFTVNSESVGTRYSIDSSNSDTSDLTNMQDLKQSRLNFKNLIRADMKQSIDSEQFLK
jgi:NADH:ubiquinone oxidoreductase subunit 5 (subunit L)/multisubunit Na+/H+ antiporter MnhA subunit